MTLVSGLLRSDAFSISLLMQKFLQYFKCLFGGYCIINISDREVKSSQCIVLILVMSNVKYRASQVLFFEISGHHKYLTINFEMEWN